MDELEAMIDTLDANDLLDPAERSRYESEVTRPLDDLVEERLPRAERDIQDVGDSGDPEQAASRVQGQLEQNADRLDQISETLAQSGDFRDVLQRLEIILELQGTVIEATESKTQGDARRRGAR